MRQPIYKSAASLSLILCVLLAAGLSRSAQATLIAHWSFEDGTANDETGNHNGAFQNGAAATLTDTAGAWSVASLTVASGNQHVSTVPIQNFGLGTGDFTIVAFVKRLTTSKVDEILGDGNVPGVSIEILDFDDVPNNAVQYEVAGPAVFGPMPISNDNQWHLVALRRQAGNISLYVDGVNTPPLADGTDLDTLAGNFGIGAHTTTLNGIAGFLDDVAIFDEFLNDGDLAAIDFGGVAVFASGAPPIPEPSTACLFLVAGALTGLARQWRRRTVHGGTTV